MKPGGIHSQGIPARIESFCASVSIWPQLGSGGGTPSPRKLRLASVRIAPAMPKVAATMIGPKALGSRWRVMMR